MEPWNDRELLPPPVNTFRCTKNIDKNGLKYICEDIVRVLRNQSPLHQEAAIMSRLVYKYDKKFRNDIGYRKFKKVNTCLRRYLVLNLLRDVEQFNSTVCPSEDYLPTRQMLEYILVRIISFAMLKVRISVTAKQSAVFYLGRLQRGDSYWMSLLPYAVLSRIWSISSVLLQKACKWYHNLYPYLNRLQQKGLPFLKDYVLPESLSEYVNLEEIDEMGKFDWTVSKRVNVVPFIKEEGENSGSFDLLKYVENINMDDCEQTQKDDEIEFTTEETNATDCFIFNKTDIGVPVSRESAVTKFTPKSNENLRDVEKSDIPLATALFINSDIGEPINRKTLLPQPTTVMDKKLKKGKTEVESTSSKIADKVPHEINSVTNAKLLKKFIKKEEKYRYKDDKRSLTEHLSFMQWQALKQNLAGLVELNDSKMCKRLKRIWKEKCLDYVN